MTDRVIDKKTFKEKYRDRRRDQQTLNRRNLPYDAESGIRKYTKKAKRMLEQGIGVIGKGLGLDFMDDYTTRSSYIDDPSFPKQNQRADQLMKDIKASGFYKTKEEQGVTKYNKGGMADYIKDLL
tara:strand:- start:595 stop:969 length:375 start_codon:yes stop_codon:yes gene_type:complete